MHHRLSGASGSWISRRSSQAITYFLQRAPSYRPLLFAGPIVKSASFVRATLQASHACEREFLKVPARRGTKVEFFTESRVRRIISPRTPARNCSLSLIGNINSRRGIARIDYLLARFLYNAFPETKNRGKIYKWKVLAHLPRDYFEMLFYTFCHRQIINCKEICLFLFILKN